MWLGFDNNFVKIQYNWYWNERADVSTELQLYKSHELNYTFGVFPTWPWIIKQVFNFSILLFALVFSYCALYYYDHSVNENNNKAIEMPVWNCIAFCFVKALFGIFEIVVPLSNEQWASSLNWWKVENPFITPVAQMLLTGSTYNNNSIRIHWDNFTFCAFALWSFYR